jgi:hypothetical protein
MWTLTSDNLINYGALATMLLGVYGLYLAATYERRLARLRRKR